MEKSWTELHVGSDITIPGVYRWVIKYVTPAFLAVMLVFWMAQQGKSVILMEGVPPENRGYVLGTRLLLLAILVNLTVLVWMAWRRRQRKEAQP